MGERFERYKARINNQPEPIGGDECNIGTLLDDYHDMLHDMFEVVDEEMTNEKWTELIETAKELSCSVPNLNSAEFGIVLYFLLIEFRDLQM